MIQVQSKFFNFKIELEASSLNEQTELFDSLDYQ